ncbi:hypothetical protein K461DRAFT_295436 [Myriangium duriaei CBS 260.36]|uniref:Large ribosomal subunit protein mL54 n=1 Tax=Myriangium duriaei CBS 260.36 TaxID=1168546 RepID=A0A9P4IXC8_9PEZI|nr:hypothetical protein K461DRAFT_295436 [Myriangium duriaei CBS 260.36]
MICNRCLRAAARQTEGVRNVSNTPSVRFRPLSTTARLASTPISPNVATQASPRPAPPSSSHQPPAATSTSAAQPFSEAATPSSPRVKKDKTVKIPKSSIPAGQKLKGLNLLKGKEDPEAMKDEDYPAWLWTLLVDKNKDAIGASAEGEGDLYAKSAKQRRKAAKALRKREALLAAQKFEPPVPIEQQSIDLPTGKAVKGVDPVRASIDAGMVRTDVTRALRKKRRADIKEANFLKGVS